MTQDQFRPYYYDRISAGLTQDGAISGWHHRTTGSSVTARWSPEGMQNGLDPDAVEGAAQTPYAMPDQLVEFVRDEPDAVTTLWWRGVGPTHNVFVVESMIDELAHQSGQDPLALRKKLAAHQPRALKVLDEVEKQSGWGKELPPGHGMGIALHYSFQTWAATVHGSRCREKWADPSYSGAQRCGLRADCLSRWYCRANSGWSHFWTNHGAL
nr:molybdopterin cofactor-binding domain-containing protein [Acetobacter malorum]